MIKEHHYTTGFWDILTAELNFFSFFITKPLHGFNFLPVVENKFKKLMLDNDNNASKMGYDIYNELNLKIQAIFIYIYIYMRD